MIAMEKRKDGDKEEEGFFEGSGCLLQIVTTTTLYYTTWP